MTFVELSRKIDKELNEMAIAGYGNWTPKKDMVSDKSEQIMKSDWNFLEDIKIKNKLFKLYKHKNIDSFILGDWVETIEGTVFVIIFSIDLKEQNSIQSRFKFKRKLYNVDGVMVKLNKRGEGISTLMYKYLVKNLNYIILGDEVQYFGARKLWSRLSKQIDIKVDIINVNSDKFLEKDIKLKHGSSDWEFDERVWSYDNSKKDIRLILRDIV